MNTQNTFDVLEDNLEVQYNNSRNKIVQEKKANKSKRIATQ